MGSAQEESKCFSLSHNRPGDGGRSWLVGGPVSRAWGPMFFLSPSPVSCTNLALRCETETISSIWSTTGRDKNTREEPISFLGATQEGAHFTFHTLLEKTYWRAAPRIGGLGSVATWLLCVNSWGSKL